MRSQTHPLCLAERLARRPGAHGARCSIRSTRPRWRASSPARPRRVPRRDDAATRIRAAPPATAPRSSRTPLSFPPSSYLPPGDGAIGRLSTISPGLLDLGLVGGMLAYRAARVARRGPDGPPRGPSGHAAVARRLHSTGSTHQEHRVLPLGVCRKVVERCVMPLGEGVSPRYPGDHPRSWPAGRASARSPSSSAMLRAARHSEPTAPCSRIRGSAWRRS